MHFNLIVFFYTIWIEKSSWWSIDSRFDSLRIQKIIYIQTYKRIWMRSQFYFCLFSLYKGKVNVLSELRHSPFLHFCHHFWTHIFKQIFYPNIPNKIQTWTYFLLTTHSTWLGFALPVTFFGTFFFQFCALFFLLFCIW